MLNITQTRRLIFQYLSQSNCLNQTEVSLLQSPHSWWLLGTQGCHLCQVAEETLSHFCKVYPVQIFTIDVTNLEESLMIQLSTCIPMLLTPNQQIYGNFSVADLQKLV